MHTLFFEKEHVFVVLAFPGEDLSEKVNSGQYVVCMPVDDSNVEKARHIANQLNGGSSEFIEDLVSEMQQLSDALYKLAQHVNEWRIVSNGGALMG